MRLPVWTWSVCRSPIVDGLDAVDCCQEFCSLVGVITALACWVFSDEHPRTGLRLGTKSDAHTRSSVRSAIVETTPIRVNDAVAMAYEWTTLTAGEVGKRAGSAAHEEMATTATGFDQLGRSTHLIVDGKGEVGTNDD
jgi:hypothetical protein